VIHAGAPVAAEYTPVQSRDVLDAIVGGTRRVLDWASRAGVQRVLFLSSGAVYGRQPSDLALCPEDYCGAPALDEARSAYGEGKRVAEFLCNSFANERALDAVMARGFTFVGPRLPLDGGFVIGNLIRDALRGGPLTITGDGTTIRSYLYGADLAIWLWTLLVRGVSARAYNVGSEQALSVNQLAQTVAALLGGRIEIRGKPSPGVPPARYLPSTARAREELGLRQWISLADAIQRTAAWIRANSAESEG
jgi:dTDP-glucose 4,6-dehydratase